MLLSWAILMPSWDHLGDTDRIKFVSHIILTSRWVFFESHRDVYSTNYRNSHFLKVLDLLVSGLHLLDTMADMSLAFARTLVWKLNWLLMGNWYFSITSHDIHPSGLKRYLVLGPIIFGPCFSFEPSWFHFWTSWRYGVGHLRIARHLDLKMSIFWVLQRCLFNEVQKLTFS